MTDLTELRRLAESATPGPWYQGSNYSAVTADVPQDVDHKVCRGFKDPEYDGRYLLCESVVHQPTAAYIAAANPTAILALLDRLAEAETIVARVGGNDSARGRLCAAMAQWLANQQHWTDLPDHHPMLGSRATDGGDFVITAGMIREANQ